MGGLDKIIESIAHDAQKQASEIIKEAEEKAAQITAQCEKDKEQITEESKIQIQEECMRSSKMIEAAAEAEARQIVLAAKRRTIEEIIEDIKKDVKNSSDKEYFELLLNLAEKNREDEDGVMYFSEKDIKRLPSDFSDKINEGLENGKITISAEPADIDGGFIIKYGKIDVNCSIDSVFEDKKNSLSDIINDILM